ncbi:CHT7 [Auxenochlorella protothecoides x Auxenochlorella symbiontica]
MNTGLSGAGDGSNSASGLPLTPTSQPLPSIFPSQTPHHLMGMGVPGPSGTPGSTQFMSLLQSGTPPFPSGGRAPAGGGLPMLGNQPPHFYYPAMQQASASAAAAAAAAMASPSRRPGGRPRNPPTAANSKRHCNCKNSRCLKLYCECFASGRYCDGCNCVGCCNNQQNEGVRQSAVEAILDRNPNAFRPKIAGDVTEEGASLGAARHNKGCNCKKSGCLKKYCECFQAGIFCSENCKCCDCKNYDGSEARAAAISPGLPAHLQTALATPPHPVGAGPGSADAAHSLGAGSGSRGEAGSGAFVPGGYGSPGAEARRPDAAGRAPAAAFPPPPYGHPYGAGMDPALALASPHPALEGGGAGGPAPGGLGAGPGGYGAGPALPPPLFLAQAQPHAHPYGGPGTAAALAARQRAAAVREAVREVIKPEVVDKFGMLLMVVCAEEADRRASSGGGRGVPPDGDGAAPSFDGASPVSTGAAAPAGPSPGTGDVDMQEPGAASAGTESPNPGAAASQPSYMEFLTTQVDEHEPPSPAAPAAAAAGTAEEELYAAQERLVLTEFRETLQMVARVVGDKAARKHRELVANNVLAAAVSAQAAAAPGPGTQQHLRGAHVPGPLGLAPRGTGLRNPGGAMLPHASSQQQQPAPPQHHQQQLMFMAAAAQQQAASMLQPAQYPPPLGQQPQQHAASP